MVVYVTDAVSAQALADLQARIKSDREVAGVTYVSKSRPWPSFREQFPSEGYLLQGLGENPLPASLLVTMAHPSRSSEAVKRWADRLKGMPGVAQVQYNRDWIETWAGSFGTLKDRHCDRQYSGGGFRHHYREYDT